MTNYTNYKILDDRVESSNATGSIARISAQTLNFLEFINISVMIIILWPTLETVASYFWSGSTDCRLTYSLELHRWVYAAFAFVNLIDIIVSPLIGHKFWGQFTFFVNVVAFFSDLMILMVVCIAYLPGCNKANYGRMFNICTDKRACGTLEYIGNATMNGCARINPQLYPLSPPVLLADLEWSYEFSFFFYSALLITTLCGVKTVCNIFIKDTTRILKAISTQAQNIIQNIGGGRPTSRPAASPIVSISTINGEKEVEIKYTKISIFFMWTIWEVRLYVISFITYVIYVLTSVSFMSWILQNKQTTKYLFKDILIAGVNYTTFMPIQNWEEFFFYAVVSLNLIPLYFNSQAGDTYGNTIAIMSSAFGSLLNMLLIFWMLFAYTLSCGMNGYPNNICTNERYRCQDPSSNLQNGCSNTYSCSTNIGPGGPNVEYTILLVFVGFALLHNIFLFVTTLFLRMKIKKIT